MLRRWGVMKALKVLRHLPTIVRVAAEYVEASYDIGRHDFAAAEKRLLRIYDFAPPGTIERTPTNLLMALVSLRLGNPTAAADLVRTGVAHVGSLRTFANAAERAYLQYAGKLIFEEATRQLGNPKTLNIGLEFDDLDMSKVSPLIRDIYPVHRASGNEKSKLH